MTFGTRGSRPVPGPTPGCQRTIIPAFSYPAPTTELWDGSIVAADPVRFLIANPADGPGRVFHDTYAAVIGRVRACGIGVLGYVDTAYGERPAALVRADIDAWKALYGVTGMFFDQAASSPDRLAHYRDIGDYARDTPAALVMLNPGTNCDEGYVEIADILNTFEGPRSQYDQFSPWDWTAGYPSSRFSHLIYDVADEAGMEAVLRESIARGAGYVYITSETVPNPWGALPPYWAAEVARIRQRSARVRSAAGQ